MTPHHPGHPLVEQPLNTMALALHVVGVIHTSTAVSTVHLALHWPHGANTARRIARALSASCPCGTALLPSACKQRMLLQQPTRCNRAQQQPLPHIISPGQTPPAVTNCRLSPVPNWRCPPSRWCGGCPAKLPQQITCVVAGAAAATGPRPVRVGRRQNQTAPKPGP